jgi:hypothetical protein
MMEINSSFRPIHHAGVSTQLDQAYRLRLQTGLVYAVLAHTCIRRYELTCGAPIAPSRPSDVVNSLS